MVHGGVWAVQWKHANLTFCLSFTPLANLPPQCCLPAVTGYAALCQSQQWGRGERVTVGMKREVRGQTVGVSSPCTVRVRSLALEASAFNLATSLALEILFRIVTAALAALPLIPLLLSFFNPIRATYSLVGASSTWTVNTRHLFLICYFVYI